MLPLCLLHEIVLTSLPQRLTVAVTGDFRVVTRASLVYQMGDNLAGKAFFVVATQARVYKQAKKQCETASAVETKCCEVRVA